MATFKIVRGQDRPTKHTTGGIGEFYKCEKTGEWYKCVFAYKPDQFSEFTYDWKLLTKEEVEEYSLNDISIGDVKPVIDEPVIEEQAVVEEELETERNINNQKRTDYTTFSKKGNK